MNENMNENLRARRQARFIINNFMPRTGPEMGSALADIYAGDFDLLQGARQYGLALNDLRKRHDRFNELRAMLAQWDTLNER